MSVPTPALGLGTLSVLLCESRGAVGAGEGYLLASASGGGAGSREHSWRSRPDCQTREKAFQEREPREPREAVWGVRVLMARGRSGGGRSRLIAEEPDVGLDPITPGSLPEPKADA